MYEKLNMFYILPNKKLEFIFNILKEKDQEIILSDEYKDFFKQYFKSKLELEKHFLISVYLNIKNEKVISKANYELIKKTNNVRTLDIYRMFFKDDHFNYFENGGNSFSDEENQEISNIRTEYDKRLKLTIANLSIQQCYTTSFNQNNRNHMGLLFSSIINHSSSFIKLSANIFKNEEGKEEMLSFVFSEYKAKITYSDFLNIIHEICHFFEMRMVYNDAGEATFKSGIHDERIKGSKIVDEIKGTIYCHTSY